MASVNERDMTNDRCSMNAVPHIGL
jgi:hypothetical protein